MPSPSFDLVQMTQSKMDHLDEVMRQHHEANDCCACEESIEGLLSLFAWLQTMEELLLRTEAESGERRQDLHDYLNQTYRSILEKCEPLLERARVHEQNNYHVAKIEEFAHVVIAAKDWVRIQDEIVANTLSHETLVDFARQAGTSLRE